MLNKNLIWFNKEGDYLNFTYNSDSELFEGDILFDENSSDTFKTQALYMFENVPSFEFELPGELTTKKFQLFNEYGFHFFNGDYMNQNINKIEPVNSDPNFYSKWIHGLEFDKKFKIGSLIRFDDDIFEFNDNKKTYVVVGNKKNAVMILSSIDNSSFEVNYDYINELYVNKTISSVNAIGVYNYIDSNLNNNLSKWSEPNFYEMFYKNRKLNVLGSELNDGVYTVIDEELSDPIHFEYELSMNDLQTNDKLIIEVLTKTDLPLLYSGTLTITDNKVIFPSSNSMPDILKPGTEFKIIGSVNNSNFVTIAPLIDFKTIANTTLFSVDDQVLFNNRIYQCVESYTQSFSGSTSAVKPDAYPNYWKLADYITCEQTLTPETINAQVYLTSDRYYFEQGYTFSSSSTLQYAANNYSSDLDIFNIDLYYNKGKLKADLKYASKYAIVNFYRNEVNPLNKIGNEIKTYERLIEVKETLKKELNYNYSSNYKYNIVFKDIDEYGISITINGMVYNESVEWIYSGLNVDMDRTIDQTLRNWYKNYYLRLISLGLPVELDYIGNYTSPFYNSIILKTDYPNVDVNINRIDVGTTANYHIEHSNIIFNNIGLYLTIRTKSIDFTTKTIYNNNLVDVSSTLKEWVNTYSEYFLTFGVIVENVNSMLKLHIKDINTPLNYTINVNKTQLPGQEDYIITNKIKGNLGVLISSNEIILPDTSTTLFTDSNFSTGMVVSLNNTFYPFMNTGFNIQYLGSNTLNLSYQGPFWSLTGSVCSSSPYVTIAFNSGFGATGCEPIGTIIPGSGGPYNITEFDSNMFSSSFQPNSYLLNNYSGTTNMVDIIYTQLNNSIYVLGDDLKVISSLDGSYITTLALPGNSNPIKMLFNIQNNNIYCISKNVIYIIEPLTNTIINTLITTYDIYDVISNNISGEIYISYENYDKISIYNNSLTSFIDLTTGASIRNGNLVYNESNNDIYLTTDNNIFVQIDGNLKTIQNTFNVSGLIFNIFYEPSSEIIYVYGTSGLYKLLGGVLTLITSVSTTNIFRDLIFNNVSGKINISDDSTFNVLDFDDTNTNIGIPGYGHMVINQYDESLYLSTLNMNSILIIDKDNVVTHQEVLSSLSTKIIYNPDRKSIFTIQPNINNIFEIKVELNSTIDLETTTFSTISDNQYGTLNSDYKPKNHIWLKTRDFIRRPRENYEGELQVEYYWKWEDDTSEDFFMYDFSGDYLETTGSYAYIGEKPLSKIVLNNSPNRSLSNISKPEYQQTIFDEISYKLSYINDEDDISVEPKPLELFIGFNAIEEGSYKRNLKLYRKERVSYDYTSNDLSYINLQMKSESNGSKYGIISLSETSTEDFLNKGFKPGQYIAVYLKDITNIDFNQYTSENNASVFIIRSVHYKQIIVDFMLSDDFIIEEKTVLSDYPKMGDKTYLKTTISVLDEEIGRFSVYGQSEIEDIRFKTELTNIGKNIDHENIYIFKSYDIHEGGVDWNFLNRKRKELLMTKHLIYPYIGSYKSIINVINFFGYNDLELNEYYKNVDTTSSNFGKLFKVEIPDIFDNTIQGWNESDFINGKYNTDKYEDTKLFNLTYNITDKDGVNVIEYSLDDVILKLEGLKYWLTKNIIPLTHKILDITGRTYISSEYTIKHKLCSVKNYDIKDEMTPITGKMNSAYIMPINSGSTVYNCVLDLYTIIPNIGYDKTLYGLIEPPLPVNGSNLTLPECYNIKVRTYKTHKEWVPYTTYNKNEYVSYYSKIYVSTSDDNKLNSPRKYENVLDWNSTYSYNTGDITKYENDFYVCKTDNISNTSAPIIDSINWENITKWREVNYKPVQTYSEYRNGSDLRAFNFTIDSNIDPFITIEITSDNGYGCIYSDRKNYELRGLKDLTDEYKAIEEILPFKPISYI